MLTSDLTMPSEGQPTLQSHLHRQQHPYYVVHATPMLGNGATEGLETTHGAGRHHHKGNEAATATTTASTMYPGVHD